MDRFTRLFPEVAQSHLLPLLQHHPIYLWRPPKQLLLVVAFRLQYAMMALSWSTPEPPPRGISLCCRHVLPLPQAHCLLASASQEIHGPQATCACWAGRPITWALLSFFNSAATAWGCSGLEHGMEDPNATFVVNLQSASHSLSALTILPACACTIMPLTSHHLRCSLSARAAPDMYDAFCVHTGMIQPLPALLKQASAGSTDLGTSLVRQFDHGCCMERH